METRTVRTAPPAAAVLFAVLCGVGIGLLAAGDPEIIRFTTPGAGLLLLLAAGGVAVIGLLLREPRLGTVVVAAFVWLNLSTVLVRFHGLPSLLQLLAIPLFVTAWAGRHVPEERPARWGPQTVLLGAYVAVLFLTTTWAEDVALAQDRAVDFLKAFALYVLAVGLCSTARILRAWIATLLVTGSVLALLGVYQELAGRFDFDFGGLARIKQAHIVGRVFEPRIAGPVGDPNFFAQVLLVLVPFALFWAWRTGSRRMRILCYSSVVALVFGVALTYSRGGALALACVLGLSLLSHGIRPRTAGIALALVLAVVPFLPREFLGRLTTLAEVLPGSGESLHPDSSIAERKLYLRVGARMFLDRPLFGVGAANFTSRFDTYAAGTGMTARMWEDDPDPSYYPHNLYVEIAAETGILGLAAWGAAVLLLFRALARARRAFAAAGEGWLADMCTATGIAIAGYLVSSLFLHGHWERYLWLLFALGSALASLAAPREGGE